MVPTAIGWSDWVGNHTLSPGIGPHQGGPKCPFWGPQSSWEGHTTPCMVLHGVVLHCVVLYCIAWYCMVFYGSILYWMVSHDITVLYSFVFQKGCFQKVSLPNIRLWSYLGPNLVATKQSLLRTRNVFLCDTFSCIGWGGHGGCFCEALQLHRNACQPF